MTKELIENIRAIIVPYMAYDLRRINYENMGEIDAEQFSEDMNEILDLATKALEQESCEDVPSAQPKILACGEGELDVSDTNAGDTIMKEVLGLIEDVLDTLIEVGNGTTDEMLHEAADELFRVRDLLKKTVKDQEQEESEMEMEILKPEPCEDAPSAQPTQSIAEWQKDFREYINMLNIPRDDYKGIMEYINDVPPAQQKIGRWKKMVSVYDMIEGKYRMIPYTHKDEELSNPPFYVCDCGNNSKKPTNYCPDCGTKMIDVPDINVGNMEEIPTGSESEDKE